jgi:hypothetical protein
MFFHCLRYLILMLLGIYTKGEIKKLEEVLEDQERKK